MPTAPVTPRAALVLTNDPLGGALIGAKLELLGWRPIFPVAGENAQTALRRLRPAVVLVDCERSDAAHRGFVGPAVMRGSPVLLFGTAGKPSVEAHARLLRVPSFTLPVNDADLGALLDRAVAGVTSPEAGPPPVA